MAEENVLQTAGKAAASFWDELVKLVTELLISFLIFVLAVFVFGEMYAIFFMQVGNEFMLWLPIFALAAILVYRVLE